MLKPATGEGARPRIGLSAGGVAGSSGGSGAAAGLAEGSGGESDDVAALAFLADGVAAPLDAAGAFPAAGAALSLGSDSAAVLLAEAACFCCFSSFSSCW